MGDPRTDEGRRALEAARWDVAREAFESVLGDEETPDALDGLGLALWFLGDVSGGVAARERAVEGYVRAGRCDDAARLAVWVSHQHFVGGRASAARGWLARAERAVEDAGLCAGRAGSRSSARGTPRPSRSAPSTRAERWRSRAQTDADDLEVFAVSLLGRAEVSAGRRDEGMRLLEEAMAAASAGRVRNVHTLAEAYCNLIAACTSAGDWERATEWCELVDEFAREHETAPLYGSCRTIHADVLLATGRWDDAERALQTALDVHARYVPEAGGADRGGAGRAAGAPGPVVGGRAASRRAGGAPGVAPRARSPAPGSGPAAGGGRAARARAARSGGRRGADRRSCSPQLVDARLAEGEVDSADDASRSDSPSLRTRSGIAVVAARAELAAARVHARSGAPGRRPPRLPAGRSPRSVASAMPYEVGGGAARARPRARARAARSSPSRRRAPPTRPSASSAPRARRDAAAAVLRELGSVDRRLATRGRRAHCPRARGARLARARDVERPDRADRSSSARRRPGTT